MTLKNTLQEITDWASRIRQGDFATRLKLSDSGYTSTEEDINRLAELLESLAI